MPLCAKCTTSNACKTDLEKRVTKRMFQNMHQRKKLQKKEVLYAAHNLVKQT